MCQLPVIFALNLQEWIGALAFGLILILRVISQISDTKKKVNAPSRPVPPQRLPQGQPAEAVAGQPPAVPLREQVDEFLRRVQEARAPGEARPVPARPVRAASGREDIEILLEDANAPQRRRVPVPPRASTPGGVQRQPQPPRERKAPRKQRPAQPGPQSVAEHVAQKVVAATQQIQEDVSRLGQRVIKADAAFDVQLQHKFDHELGSLDSRHASRMEEQKPVDRAPSQAAQMAALLSSPDGIRQAIVLNEILRRPEERW